MPTVCQTQFWTLVIDIEVNKTDNLLLSCSLHWEARGVGGGDRKRRQSQRVKSAIEKNKAEEE